MMDEQMKGEREAFEAWQAEDLKSGVNYDADSYAWDAWQARAALSASPPPSGEVEAVEVVGYRVEWKTNPKGSVRKTLADQMPTTDLLQMDYPQGELIGYADLMTVSQHQRIVAAKDAEIARLRIQIENEKVLTAQANYHKAQRGQVIDELRAQLAAQQAAVPVAYLRESDLNRLKPGYVAGCAASMNKEPAAGYVPIYLSAPAAPQQGDHSAQSLNMVMPDALQGAFITGESGNGQYRVVLKFDTLEAMQAAHNWFARLNADRSAQGEKP